MTRLRKQYEESVQERNSAVRERNVLKSQCTHAIMQWDIAIRERNTFMDYLAKMQLQHEEEMNKGMAVRMKSTKDLKRLTEERNAAMEEYSLVMRERDTVHKEIEKLQDDLAQANEKIKSLEAKNVEVNEEKKLMDCKVESLHREIKSALEERDLALKVSFVSLFLKESDVIVCLEGLVRFARAIRRAPGAPVVGQRVRRPLGADAL